MSKYTLHISLFFHAFLFWIAISCSNQPEGLWIETITCDFKEQPVGICNNLTFSWILNSVERGQYQTAYQLIISDNKKLIPGDQNTWNSGKVNSNQSVGVHAKGLMLKPGQKYYWRIKVWDKNNLESSWSETASFITALFEEKDWQNAKWISNEEMNDSLVLVP
jgi:alpha-L-rhamnosidase